MKNLTAYIGNIMRPRTKASAVCSANPQGRRNTPRKEILKRKFDSGEITEEELEEYVCLFSHSQIQAHLNRVPKAIVTTMWGKRTMVPYDEFKAQWEPQGFKIIEIVY